jgi:hypothetical protein
MHPEEFRTPNGLRLSGDGGEADGVRCNRGLGACRSLVTLDSPTTSSEKQAPLACYQRAK